MENTCPFSNCTAKEKALYESVLSLIEEGGSIGSLKVSVIAQRAGIGKGTTYEYFKSKEELIGKALFYDLHRKIQNLLQKAGQVSGFRNILYTVFDWMEENLEGNQFLYQLLSINGVEYKIPDEIRDMLVNQTKAVTELEKSLEEFGNVAKAEGLIPMDAPKSLLNIAIANTLISYMVYLKMHKSVQDVDSQQMKLFLYNSIVKAFQP